MKQKPRQAPAKKVLETATRFSGGRRASYSDAQLVQARKAWDQDKSIGEIRRILGLASDAGVHYVRKVKGWPARDTAAVKSASIKGQRKAAATSARPKVESTSTPPRRCEACQLTTTRDPCEHCGKPWHQK
jgi:hypothetical protein